MFQKGVPFGHFRGGNERHIQEVLPVVLKFGNDMFGDNWMFQQDGGRAHIHQKTEDWCRTVSLTPDLNPMDYCI